MPPVVYNDQNWTQILGLADFNTGEKPDGHILDFNGHSIVVSVSKKRSLFVYSIQDNADGSKTWIRDSEVLKFNSEWETTYLNNNKKHDNIQKVEERIRTQVEDFEFMEEVDRLKIKLGGTKTHPILGVSIPHSDDQTRTTRWKRGFWSWYKSTNTQNKLEAGAVYVMEYDGHDWKQRGNTILGFNKGDKLGRGFSMTENGNVIVLAYKHPTLARYLKIELFRLTTNNNWHSEKRWAAKEAVPADLDYNFIELDLIEGHFGELDQSSEFLAIGVPYFNEKKGAVSTFQYKPNAVPGQEWTQLGSPITTDKKGSLKGFSLSFNRNTCRPRLAIGAPAINAGNSGKSYIYQFGKCSPDGPMVENSDWEELETFELSDQITGAESGYEVSLSSDGRTVAIGSPGVSEINGECIHGLVSVYHEKTDGNWILIGRFLGNAIIGEIGKFLKFVDVNVGSKQIPRLAIGTAELNSESYALKSDLIRVFELDVTNPILVVDTELQLDISQIQTGTLEDLKTIIPKAKAYDTGANSEPDLSGDPVAEVNGHTSDIQLIKQKADDGTFGHFEVKYSYSDGAGNSAETMLIVTVKDDKPPVISGSYEGESFFGNVDHVIYLEAGDSFGNLVVQATDNENERGAADAMVTIDQAEIKCIYGGGDQTYTNDWDPDCLKPGFFKFEYTATDGSDNNSQFLFFVEVKDTLPPVINYTPPPRVHECDGYNGADAYAKGIANGSLTMTTEETQAFAKGVSDAGDECIGESPDLYSTFRFESTLVQEVNDTSDPQKLYTFERYWIAIDNSSIHPINYAPSTPHPPTLSSLGGRVTIVIQKFTLVDRTVPAFVPTVDCPPLVRVEWDNVSYPDSNGNKEGTSNVAPDSLKPGTMLNIVDPANPKVVLLPTYTDKCTSASDLVITYEDQYSEHFNKDYQTDGSRQKITRTYYATDKSGNVNSDFQQTIWRIDTKRPIISLLGGKLIYKEYGSSEYVDPGATATDPDHGEDLTSRIETTGVEDVDVNKPGEYKITYNVCDEGGNEAFEVERVVIVTACFTGDAILKTDQGLVEIKDMDTNYTIGGRVIKGISKTIYTQDKIVAIEKNAFGENKPNKKTLVAPFHKFLINGKMRMAAELVNEDTIYLTKYKKQPLYNIILEKQGLMEINNVIVETLDPETLVAKLFDGSMDKEQKNKVIDSINKYHNNLQKKSKKTIKDYRI